MPKTRVKTPQKNTNETVRPIGARALKSAIDTIRPYLHGADVLDLFSGQGRFGATASIELIRSVTFVEKDRNVAKQIDAFIGSKQFPKEVNAKVINQDALSYLKACALKFDVVFADPPFPLWNEEFQNELFLGVAGVLTEESIFLVKHPSRMLLSPLKTGWNLVKKSEFGESTLFYLSYEAVQ